MNLLASPNQNYRYNIFPSVLLVTVADFYDEENERKKKQLFFFFNF